MDQGDSDPGLATPAPLAPEALKAALDLHRAWLESEGAEGARAELAGASLRSCSLWGADLRRADLAQADLEGANLDHARLGGASLRGTRLAGASLWGADLEAASLATADLRRAKLDHAVLRGASLRGADLTLASFWGAHLEGADLGEAAGLTAAQLEPAIRDAATRLPVLAPAAPAEPEDDPILLDEHRGMAAQKATELRRQLAEVEFEQAALRQRQAELERHLLAAPAASWEEAAEKAQYLITLLADSAAGRDPRRQRIIASVLEDFRRLSKGRLGPDEAGQP